MKWLVVLALLAAGCASAPDAAVPGVRPVALAPTPRVAVPTPVATFSVVVTCEGVPVVGARVRFRGSEETTDSQGRASIVVDWNHVQTRVSAEGFAPTECLLEPNREEAVSLARAASIAGRITTTGGEPIASAEVHVHRDSSRRSEARTRSNGRGEFELGGLASGATHEIQASAAGFAPVTIQVRAPRTDLVVVLARPARLTLTVVPPRPDYCAYVLNVHRRVGEGWEVAATERVSKTPPFVHELDLAPGLYRAEIDDPGLGVASVESITLIEQDTVSRTLTLPGPR